MISIKLSVEGEEVAENPSQLYIEENKRVEKQKCRSLLIVALALQISINQGLIVILWCNHAGNSTIRTDN